MKKIFCFLLFFCLFSCYENKSIESNDIYISLDNNKKLFEVNDLFENYNFIPLETNDSVLLKKIENYSKIVIKNKYIYIEEQLSVEIFDSDGRFLKRISRYGEGTEDYLSINNFMVWEDGTISINDRLSQSILSYSKDGDYVGRIRLKDISIKDITDLTDSLLIAKSDHRNPNNKFKFHIFNRYTHELVNSYEPISQYLFSYWVYDCFPRYNGKLLFNEPQNNNIYELTKDSAVIRYIVDFDGRKPPEGFWAQQEKTGLQLNEERLKERYIDNINFFAEGVETILLQFNGGTGVYENFALIDKRNLNSVLFNEIVFDPGFKWEPSKMYAMEDGWLIVPIPAHIIYEKANEDFLSRFPNLKEDDNPILFIAKLK
jgi:hypothetical protein